MKKEKGLKETIEEIKKKFGEGAIMKLKEVRPASVEVIPTGSISLDLALGVLGIPRGRVIEIFGPEASGKTTLALHILAEAQKMKEVGAFIDAEHALDPDYGKKIGVNVEELLISQPDSGEQALEIVETLVRSGKISAIVIDSVAALAPKVEIEGEMGDTQIGLQARLLSKALRKLSAIVSKTKTAVIFLNQTRMKVGIPFGSPETTPGGLALKFYSSVRIRLERIAKIKQADKIVGSRIRAQVVKNKVAPPFKTAEFDIYYNEGINKYVDLLRAGVKYEVISQKGAFYQFEEKKLGRGLEEAKKFLKENKKLADKIKRKIIEVVLKEKV